jgi:SanA protein
MKRALLSLLIACEIVIAFILVINVGIHMESSRYIYGTAANAPDAEVVVIPGASVLGNGDLSPILQDRADLAIQLYNAKRVLKILVSGDNGTLSYNEVTPVHNYLVQNGIPERDIFLDHAGFDTYSTMYRARDIFGVSSILVVSQSFHLPRAVFIARELGITAYGVTASDSHVNWGNYARELFADGKALLDLIDGRQPQYLGTPIPISGNGTQS